MVVLVRARRGGSVNLPTAWRSVAAVEWINDANLLETGGAGDDEDPVTSANAIRLEAIDSNVQARVVASCLALGGAM